MSYAWYPQQIIDVPGGETVLSLALQRDLLAIAGTALHVYGREAGQWKAWQTVQPEQGNEYDGFGNMAFAGDTLWVGSQVTDIASGAEHNFVHRFERAGTQLDERQRFEVQGPPRIAAHADDLIAVAAPFVDPLAELDQGVVALYERRDEQFELLQTLMPPDTQGQRFGSSVAFVGEVLVVGAPRAADRGLIYLFEREDGRYVQRRTLAPKDTSQLADFGMDMAASNDRLLVAAPFGAREDAFDRGSAYVFVRAPEGLLQEEQELRGPETESTGGFGISVALHADTALVGMKNRPMQGKAMLFTRADSGWSLQQALAARSGFPEDAFGEQVTTFEDTLAVTAISANATGQVHIWARLRSDGSACDNAAQCGSARCAASVCCATDCGACGSCADGTCRPIARGDHGAPACAPFVCDGQSDACPTACVSHAQCAGDHFCDADHCAPRRALGESCKADAWCEQGRCVEEHCRGDAALATACHVHAACESGQCVDGVCCDTACEGACEACDVAAESGHCAAVSGAPHGVRSCPGQGSPCAGACDGDVRADCAFPLSGSVCDSYCEDRVLTESLCTGAGECVPSTPRSCGELKCADARACLARCAQDDDCREGLACADGACRAAAVCVDDHTARSAGDDPVDCSPFGCDSEGRCRKHCSNVRDCATGYVCNRDGACVERAAPETSATASGCAAVPGRRPPPTAAGCVLLMLALALWRRKR